jgi:hypothetical protein
MDEIAETARQVIDIKQSNHPTMSIYPIIYKELQGCPRFIFDDAAIETAVELTLGRPKILLEAMKNLKIPYPKLWIEWPESGRERLREIFTINEKTIDPGRPLPSKVGFLLETDANGRKGVVYWAWNIPEDKITKEIKFNPPNICPISPYFDLDKDFPQDKATLSSFITANLCNLWKDNDIQQEALLGIWRTANHVPSHWGQTYLTSICGNNKEKWFHALNNFYADVYGEYIMIWSILLLLTSSKKIIEEVGVDLSHLNKARTKRNQVPKFNYTKINMYIDKSAQHVKFIKGPLGYTRKSPRIHLVSSYLGRRGDKHWVVQPFWRGEGEVISRHVHVHDKQK